MTAGGRGCGVAERSKVVIAQAACEDVGAGRDPAAERGRVGVHAGVDHRNRTVLPIVGYAQRAQVVQANQGSARRVGQVGRRLELPDPLVVGSKECRTVRREADAERSN